MKSVRTDNILKGVRKMGVKEFLDLLHELIVVDTEYGLVDETCIAGDSIIVKLKSGSSFVVRVEKA